MSPAGLTSALFGLAGFEELELLAPPQPAMPMASAAAPAVTGFKFMPGDATGGRSALRPTQVNARSKLHDGVRGTPYAQLHARFSHPGGGGRRGDRLGADARARRPGIRRAAAGARSSGA